MSSSLEQSFNQHGYAQIPCAFAKLSRMLILESEMFSGAELKDSGLKAVTVSSFSALGYGIGGFWIT
jgi:hypothetical protein